MDNFDSIVIGAGHNGLVCAAYLARGGHRVLVLEASDKPGGLGASREFHPGFHASVAHSISHFSTTVARELDLFAHGFDATERRIPTIGLGTDGKHVTLADGRLDGGSAADEDAYRRFRALMQKFARALEPFWLKTMPRIGVGGFGNLMTFAHIGLNVRRMGSKDMREFLRVASLPVRDLMDEYFEDELVKSTLCWDGLIGAKMAPRSPNSAVLALLYRMGAAANGAHAIPVGGVSGLIDALCKSVRAAGAEIRCRARVKRIAVRAGSDGLTATGVVLDDGTAIAADRVVSAADPKRTFLAMVGVESLDIEFANRIRRLRCEGYVGKLHLALNGLPTFDGLREPAGRLLIAPDMDAIEFAYDDAKYGCCSQEPVLELVVPSVYDTIHAPAGHHVLSASVMYVPYGLRQGWTDDARERICQRSVDAIARYAPGIHRQIVHAEFLTPADLEGRFNVTGGHWHHTEFATDQMLMMRPTYEAAQYSTPIPGLFLCGAGSHPGGDLVGGAGRNAARQILQ